ncbi:MAG: hypothetical protein QG620_789 [Patescibacteria group bacterium]|nr:hypothetical protein [Patescibacteria group bacterium]
MIGEKDFGKKPEGNGSRKVPIVCKWCGRNMREKDWEGGQDVERIDSVCEECKTKELESFKKGRERKEG